ncbi:MAG: DNA alkylation repair protein [Deltaproteobacteria bacterium]|jgi:3-methyladenine DNA glycosylase AlkD|nr:DNA alkylation repair protein [Deltaproteobacteria bacterium]
MPLKEIKNKLHKLGDVKRAEQSTRYFKTGPGEYGEGDIFWGIPVPELRKLSRTYRDIPLETAAKLLQSPIHEERMLALLILVMQYAKADAKVQKRVYTLYLKNTPYINNWDLVDLSAHYIVGPFLTDKSKKPLYRLAASRSLWERRIAIMATFHYIRRHTYSETLKIAEMLISDKEDLIHKAVGWMLREVGKRDLQTEEEFLKPRYKDMPRTMLRYAIEKFPAARRKRYLKGEI